MKFIHFYFFIIVSANAYSQNNNYDYLINKSIEYIELENFNKGRDFAQKAYKINPERGEAYYCLAVIKLSECKNDNKNSCIEGLFFVEKLDTYLNNYRNSHFVRGSLQAKIKDYEGSLISFNKAIELKPKSGYYYYNRGYVLFKLGKEKLFCNDLRISCDLGYSRSCKLYLKNCGN